MADDFEVELGDLNGVVDGAMKKGAKKLRVEVVDEEPEMVEVELPKGRPAPPLEQYVADHRKAVQLELDKGLKEAIYKGKGRVDRAEDYARWRWHGYVNGEIASL